MKNSMAYLNRIGKNARRNIRPLSLTVALVAVANFGMKAFGFLQNLITVGCTPFENLNRGQMRQMSWLFAMYRI